LTVIKEFGQIRRQEALSFNVIVDTCGTGRDGKDKYTELGIEFRVLGFHPDDEATKAQGGEIEEGSVILVHWLTGYS
jgi:hypothetical protein